MFGNERPGRPSSANPRKPILPTAGRKLVRPQSAPIGYHAARQQAAAAAAAGAGRQQQHSSGTPADADTRRRRYFFGKPSNFEEPRYFE